MGRLKVGDPVIYHKPKSSNHPGPRATNVHASAHGDSYRYAVDKFWRVSEVVDSQTVEVVTRRGKRHRLSTTDPFLRKAGPFARLLHRHDFPPAHLPTTPTEGREG